MLPPSSTTDTLALYSRACGSSREYQRENSSAQGQLSALSSVRTVLIAIICTSITAWGVVLMCIAACKNYAGLLVVRFILGVCEAW